MKEPTGNLGHEVHLDVEVAQLVFPPSLHNIFVVLKVAGEHAGTVRVIHFGVRVVPFLSPRVEFWGFWVELVRHLSRETHLKVLQETHKTPWPAPFAYDLLNDLFVIKIQLLELFLHKDGYGLVVQSGLLLVVCHPGFSVRVENPPATQLLCWDVFDLLHQVVPYDGL